MPYLISLAVLIAIYVIVVCNMKHMKNTKIFNLIFAGFVFVPYIIFVYGVYIAVGPDNWNFHNTLAYANVSPFMFTLVPFIFVMPSKIKNHFHTLISLLCVGMFFANVFNCVNYLTKSTPIQFHFLLDFVSHFSLSLWGIYLVKSGQVVLSKKNFIKGFLIIFSVATLMLVLNLILDTAFFGLSLTGKHNIYNIILTSSSILSVCIYYIGLTLVCYLGYIFGKIIPKKEEKYEK